LDSYDELVESADNFTPKKVQSFPLEKFTGLSINNIPKDTDHGHILEFLVKNGLPEDKKEAVQINNNGSIMINDLDSYIIEYLTDSIHGKVNFGRKIYCNGVLPLTPQKSVIIENNRNKGAELGQAQPGLGLASDEVNSESLMVPIDSQFLDNDAVTLARRHSLSLLNRYPHKNSIADELLNTPREGLMKTSSVIDELKERLSDFASCVSDSSNYDSNEEQDLVNGGFKTVNEKKLHKKNKRKVRVTPKGVIFKEASFD